MLDPLIEVHEKNTGVKAEACVADSKYGTKENYLKCHDLGIRRHFDPIEKSHRGYGVLKYKSY